MASQLPLKARLDLYRVMAQYVADGQSIQRLLENKAERAKNKRISNGKIFIQIGKLLEENSIASSLKPFIPADEYIFLRTAEVRSNLGGTLRSLILIAQSKSEMKKTFTSILIKPFMFFFISIFGCAIAFYGLIPEIYSLINDDNSLSDGFKFFFTVLNPSAQALFPVIVSVIVGSLVFFVFTLGSFIMFPFRAILDRLSIIHIVYKDFTSAVMLVSLGATLRGEEHINNFFQTISVSGNDYEAHFALKMLDRLRDGRFSVAEAIDIGFFSAEDIEQIFDYTSGGANVISALSEISATALERASERAKRMLNVFSWVYMISFLFFLATYMGVGMSAVIGFFQQVSALSG